MKQAQGSLEVFILLVDLVPAVMKLPFPMQTSNKVFNQPIVGNNWSSDGCFYIILYFEVYVLKLVLCAVLVVRLMYGAKNSTDRTI